MNRLKGLSLAFLAFAIVVTNLVGNGYHPFSLEVGVVAGGLSVLFFAIGYLSHRILHRVILAFMSYWLIDAYFLTDDYYSENVWILVVLLFALILVFWLVSRYSQTILPLAAIIFSLVFALPELADFPDPVLVKDERDVQPADVDQRYAYLHIILDEHMSPLALPDSVADAHDPQSWFDDYVAAGFQMNGFAMSKSRATRRSLGGIFGLTEDMDNYVKGDGAYSYEVETNRVLASLQAQGFDVTVIESNYLEVCSPDVTQTCETYSRAANMSVLSRTVDSPIARIKLALLSLHQGFNHTPHLVEAYSGIADRISEARGWGDADSWGFFSRSVFNVEILQDIAERARAMESGDALIAHLMFPHYPYVMDADCGVKDITDWTYPNRSNDVAAPPLDVSYRGYLDQTHCTHKTMGILFDAIADRDDMIVVVHGDHGSRIAVKTPDASDADSRSTFLAVRAPGLTPSLSVQEVSLQGKFMEYYNGFFDQ